MIPAPVVGCPTCLASYPDGTSECPEDGSALLPEEMLAGADAPLAPGTMAGEYRVDRKLGEGSFGAVYAGEQPLIGKKVAIKVLHRSLSSDPEAVSRFIAEARAVNRIRNRNIIDIFSFGLLPDRQHYFVMELLDGLTLGDLLEREGRLSVPRALPILSGIADGLDAAHAVGITHRDLKPDNIFLAIEKNGYFPKLLDFGIAKLVMEDAAHKTATGVAVGTPRYMAPEQSRGRAIDHRADIYALGVVTHEMLTGHPPFDGESMIDVMLKHATEPPPPMSRVCGDLPPQLDAPVAAMLAKRPADRPSSAGAAVAALIQAARAVGLDEDASPVTPAPAAAQPAASGQAPQASVSTLEVPEHPAAPPPQEREPAVTIEAPESAPPEVDPANTKRSPGALHTEPMPPSAMAAAVRGAVPTVAAAPLDAGHHPPRPHHRAVVIAAAVAGVTLGVIVFLLRTAAAQRSEMATAGLGPLTAAATAKVASAAAAVAPSVAPAVQPPPAASSAPVAPAATTRKRPAPPPPRPNPALEKPPELGGP